MPECVDDRGRVVLLLLSGESFVVPEGKALLVLAAPAFPGGWNRRGDELLRGGLYKTEVIRRKGPWRTLEAVEFATLTWVDWFNTRRLLGPLGDIPPAEFEAQYYEQAAVA